MRLVAKWGLGDARDAEQILNQAGSRPVGRRAVPSCAATAQKSAATTRSVSDRRALQFMNVPAARRRGRCPGNWDIEQFIRDKGIALPGRDSGSEHNPLAPLFSCIATEVAYLGGVVGSKMPGARLSPPLGLFLDEVCQICPLPLPQILSDAGGRGIRIVTGGARLLALADRYGEHGAQTIMNTSGVKIWLGGSAEPKTLELITKLAGHMRSTSADRITTLSMRSSSLRWPAPCRPVSPWSSRARWHLSWSGFPATTGCPNTGVRPSTAARWPASVQ